MTEGPRRPLRAGDFVSMRPKHVMTHDNTSAVMKKFKSIGATKIYDSHQPVFALDHDIQNQSEVNLEKYRAIEAFAREHGIDFYPAGTGIGHQIMCERGYVTPGSFVVASDSHSNMYGALGTVGTPVVRTDAAAIWATGEFWWQIPRTVQVVFEGELKPGVTGKDVIIALCGAFNTHVLNAAVEFSGPGVTSLSMDARMTIANMSTEWGTLVGWFPCDGVTIRWLRERREERVRRAEAEKYSEEDLNRWAAESTAKDVCATRLSPDPDADYAARITLNLSHLTPHVSGPDTVQEMISLAELEPKKIAIQKAYLLSCVNSRVEDLEQAAQVLQTRKIAASVNLYLGAASKWVQEEAERRGIWRTLVDAGATTLPAGCGPCIGLGVGLLEPGEVGISATNRNFKGRMGSREAQCYLASPAVVAASAVAGYICGPEAIHAVGGRRSMVDGRKKPQGGMFARYKNLSSKRGAKGTESPGLAKTGLDRGTLENEVVEIVPGFPERVRGRLVFVPKDNLNTDAIYPGSYTYRDDVTAQMMADVAFSNYDAEFPKLTLAGDVVVGGANFGTGSSLEQAATSLKAKGFPLVMAASFSQTYLRNAFNNGLLCIEVPELVTRLKAEFAQKIAAQKVIIPGDEIEVEFRSGVVTWRGDQFHFPPLGSVPQSLVVAGGVERFLAKRLKLA